MIKPEDLRIGNLLWFSEPKDINRHRAIKVKEINSQRILFDDMGLDLSLHKDQLEPIPLTPELLVKFENVSKHDNKNGHYWAIAQEYPNGNCGVKIIVEHDDCLFLQLGKGLIVALRSVHHFQNLYYSVTSQELTITL